MYQVYLHTSPSGKSYVGWCSCSMEQRWKRHIYDALKRGFKMNLHTAIRKYGPENWTHTILEECESKENALKSEIKWIAKLGTKHPNGYNLTDGGEGTHGAKWTEESKAKIRVPKTESHRANMRGKTIPKRQREFNSARQIGSLNHCSKFSDAEIQKAKDIYNSTELSYSKVGKLMNMSGSYVRDLVIGRFRTKPTPDSPPVYTQPA